MEGYLHVFLLFVVIAAAFGEGTESPDSTSSSPSPTTSTKIPTTSTKIPTTSTSTTPTPITTKEVTTTSEKPLTTTTDKPTTTSAGATTAVLTTTMVPPSQQINTFYDNSKGNDSVCIVVQMATNFTITYLAMDDKNKTSDWEFPAKSIVSQNCGTNTSTEQSLTIVSGSYKLEMSFAEIADNKKYNLSKMVFSYDTSSSKDFPNAKDPKKESALYDSGHYEAPVGNSYECNSQQNFNMKNYVQVTMQNVQFQAFMDKDTDKGIKFSTAVQCSADVKTNNIVPIAVGAALAALVVIVLVAYLISRNRNQGGYESV